MAFFDKLPFQLKCSGRILFKNNVFLRCFGHFFLFFKINVSLSKQLSLVRHRGLPSLTLSVLCLLLSLNHHSETASNREKMLKGRFSPVTYRIVHYKPNVVLEKLCLIIRNGEESSSSSIITFALHSQASTSVYKWRSCLVTRRMLIGAGQTIF